MVSVCSPHAPCFGCPRMGEDALELLGQTIEPAESDSSPFGRCPSTVANGLHFGLSEDFLHDLAMHVGQPEIPATIAEREPLVIDTEKVKDCRM